MSVQHFQLGAYKIPVHVRSMHRLLSLGNTHEPFATWPAKQATNYINLHHLFTNAGRASRPGEPLEFMLRTHD